MTDCGDRVEHVIGQGWHQIQRGGVQGPLGLGSPGAPWMSLGPGMPSWELV